MKHFSVIILIVMFLMTFVATGTLFANQNEHLEEQMSQIEENVQIDGGAVTITKTESSDLTSRFEQKGYEVINFLRRIAQPLAILAFLIGALMIVIGQITGSRMKNTGMMVLLFTAISYAGIVFAPEILDSFISWLSA